jgi:alpha-D-xyloside xylohydrolase
MPLEFPADPGCDTLDRQYMLGHALLVAPVFRPDGQVDFYLPAGRWTHFLSGKVLEGGRWVRETHDYLSLPLYARSHSVIATGANDQRPDYDFADGVTLQVFDLQAELPLAVTIPTLAGQPGSRFELVRQGRQITVRASNPHKPWQVLLRGIPSAASVANGTAQAAELGTLIIPQGMAQEMTIDL